MLSEPTTQIIDNRQMPQLVYQQASPSNQIHTDGQIQYIFQEEESPSDNYVQPATQQVYYKVSTENGSQIVQHHGKYASISCQLNSVT